MDTNTEKTLCFSEVTKAKRRRLTAVISQIKRLRVQIKTGGYALKGPRMQVCKGRLHALYAEKSALVRELQERKTDKDLIADSLGVQKEMTSILEDTGTAALYPPKTRAGCPDTKCHGCEHLRCRYHLWFDNISGKRKPSRMFGDTSKTCLFDLVTDGVPQTMLEVSKSLLMSRQRVDQIEKVAKKKARKMLWRDGLELDDFVEKDGGDDNAVYADYDF